MIKPSDFKNIGTMKAYTFSQTDSGGVNKVLAESLNVWMKFEQLGGGTGPSFSQIASDANFIATMRYNAAFNTNWILEYEGQNYKIDNIKTDDVSYKRFMILECSTSIKLQDWS